MFKLLTSNHSHKEMNRRGITMSEIYNTLYNAEVVTKGKGNKVVFERNTGPHTKHYIVVVFEPKGVTLITSYYNGEGDVDNHSLRD